MGLEGKVAFITGASHGIGEAVALQLAADGADIAFNYAHDEKGADGTAEQIRKLGRKAVNIQANSRDVNAIRQMVAEAVDKLGRVDILVNNAGIETKADFWDVTEDDYDKVMDINLKGAFFAAQAVVRQLRESKRHGKIINMSSVHEDLPFPGFASYCMSKGGMRMMTRDLAVELGPLGITVNAIAPGAIETPINTKLMNSPELLKALTEKIPLGRLGQTSDVAGLVSFLASSAADYITGATYFIDGGLTYSYHEQ